MLQDLLRYPIWAYASACAVPLLQLLSVVTHLFPILVLVMCASVVQRLHAPALQQFPHVWILLVQRLLKETQQRHVRLVFNETRPILLNYIFFCFEESKHLYLDLYSVQGLQRQPTHVYLVAELDTTQQNHYVGLPVLPEHQLEFAKFATNVRLPLMEYVLVAFQQALLLMVPRRILSRQH